MRAEDWRITEERALEATKVKAEQTLKVTSQIKEGLNSSVSRVRRLAKRAEDLDHTNLAYAIYDVGNDLAAVSEAIDRLTAAVLDGLESSNV